MALMNILDVKLGFTFSAGLFDYLLSGGIGKNALLLIPVGLIYGLIYYFLFVFVITKWNLKTPGREEEPAVKETVSVQPLPESEDKQNAPVTRGQQYVQALGGKENIASMGACATRLRLEVKNPDLVNTESLKQLGARGVVKGAAGSVQVVIGPEADMLCDEIKPYLN